MKGMIGLMIVVIASSCANRKNNHTSEMNDQNNTTHKHTNDLIHETSPYLLQHAHNPVNWLAWSPEVFEKAKAENKLVLVSVGYSACHWCHVMEHESFEDEDVASFMNEHFYCIKVDREERPDVDQVYMSAVQIMTGRGGWPLNCFTMPDGKPIYGGTYFRKDNWMDVMKNLVTLYDKNPDKVLDYAEKLTKGVKQNETLVKQEVKPFTEDAIHESVEKWQTRFDEIHGGPNQEPKFPLPNNYLFLMQYAHQFDKPVVRKHVALTLKKMAYGGIYDQIGGGFARYSVDNKWKVPHFEKMLYDNGQLMSLYAQAWKENPDPLYKEVVYGIYAYLESEMLGDSGEMYSALDADSEGEEGKYYIWSADEIRAALKDDSDFAIDYYNVNGKGFWEHGRSILLRDKPDSKFADAHGMSIEAVREKVEKINKELLEARAKRIKPGLDDKTLTSWNALMVIGLLDAYDAFGDNRFYETALTTLQFLVDNQMKPDGELYHNYKNGKSTISGFLEDYAILSEAFIKAYQVRFDEKWLEKARMLTQYVMANFYSESSGMFTFNNKNGEQLIAETTEFQDNVIPSSNSCMAKVLYLLGILDENENYLSVVDQMLANVAEAIPGYGSGFSNWAQLYLWRSNGLYQVAVTGKDCVEKRNALAKHYLPNVLLLGADKNSTLPLLEGKFLDETTIFVCVERYCKEPVQDVSAALNQIK